MGNDDSGNLPAHYERHLGKIDWGWSDSGKDHGIQIVRFKGQPEEGVMSYATLGLSRYPLDLPRGRKVRQELLMSVNDSSAPEAVAGFLLSLAEFILERGRALLRGEIVGPGSPVTPGSTLSAAYATNPTPFDKALTTFASDPPTVFAYVIPVSKEEASLVRKHGWSWFEDRLEQQNPDIWDLARSQQIRRVSK